MIVSGIGSCDSCRKARKWLDEQGIEHDWVDLRETGVTTADLRRWLKAVGPDVLVNRRSTTWRRAMATRCRARRRLCNALYA